MTWPEVIDDLIVSMTVLGLALITAWILIKKGKFW